MYKTYEELMSNNPSVVIWGSGMIMRKYIKKINPFLNIRFFADTFPHKWGTYPAKEIDCAYNNVICKSKDEIQSSDVVLIAVKADKDNEIISAELDERGISYCYIIEAVAAYMPAYEAMQLEHLMNHSSETLPEYDSDKIVKYISCHVPYTYCNFRCSYCYVKQLSDFQHKKNYFHSPEFIRASLSKKRLGGVALVNFCAAGETLLCKDMVPIIAEIVKEGHFVSIVTNGTITKAFDELLDSGANMEQVFIKFSFHYLELKRLNLFDIFVSNVRRMRSAGCSISVELTPSDDLIPYIDEIKSFSMREFGTYPHITVARDDTSNDAKVLTDLTFDKYKEIWGTFDSAMFDFKMTQVYKKRFENCLAGELSAQLNLETGDLFKCIGNPYIDNVYEDLCRDIKFNAVGSGCRLPYCWNCHSYLALGVVKELQAPTYYEIRDRETIYGEHWVHGRMAEIFKQRLYDNIMDERTR